ncbi:hypothetical protein KY285_014817 [Solanum tuberosum]|nr:hypothetical protein KY285_014817 [Solanum tuberosum]
MKAGSAAKLIVDALLQRFLPLARRRIETAQAQDGQYLRPSDPAYEQVLDSLAMVARHTPVPLLEALLRWRESESPKGANDASTFQRKLAVECIFCSACIRFVECCPQEGLTENLWIGLENFVFDWLINADRVVSQVEYPSLVDLRGLLLDLVAQLLGALSRIRFSSVTERFFMELNTRRIDTNVARSEALSIINGMRYLKLGVKTEGGLNASASFVAKANPLNRAPHKRKSELHHALCNMLSNILAPLADGVKGQWPPSSVDPALTLWYEAVARIRIQLMHWMDKQSKHISVGYPLVTLLLCLGDPHVFLSNFGPHMEQLYKHLKDKNHRFMALDCLHRVLRFYLSVHGDSQPPNRVWDYLDSVTSQLLTVLRKGMLTQDVQHDKLVEFCVTIAEHNIDFAMNHMILELLKQDSPSEAKVIGLRALLAIVMSPTSQHVGLEILHVRGIGHFIPKVKAAIESILRSCHRTYSQALLTSSRTTIVLSRITVPSCDSIFGDAETRLLMNITGLLPWLCLQLNQDAGVGPASPFHHQYQKACSVATNIAVWCRAKSIDELATVFMAYSRGEIKNIEHLLACVSPLLCNEWFPKHSALAFGHLLRLLEKGPVEYQRVILLMLKALLQHTPMDALKLVESTLCWEALSVLEALLQSCSLPGSHPHEPGQFENGLAGAEEKILAPQTSFKARSGPLQYAMLDMELAPHQ